jgi:hypothetical protein
MKPKIFYFLFVLFFFLFWGGCSEDEPKNVTEDLVFHSLVAEKDTIAPGEIVKITAFATGSQLKYFWSAKPFGDILDAGAEVRYSASMCAIGKNTITCRVTNGPTQEETKTIDIVVYE